MELKPESAWGAASQSERLWKAFIGRQHCVPWGLFCCFFDYQLSTQLTPIYRELSPQNVISHI
jgi:hypothetical protein